MLDEYAWYGESMAETPHPVGLKKPNDWGLQDMCGNVWEWVVDRYANYSGATQTDPVGSATGEYRVLRGGAFDYSSGYLRSAFRSWNLPTYRDGNVGFRCARGLRRHP